MISIDEYLHTSFRPDCDFVDGEVRERNVGMRRHPMRRARSYPGLIGGERLGLQALANSNAG